MATTVVASVDSVIEDKTVKKAVKVHFGDVCVRRYNIVPGLDTIPSDETTCTLGLGEVIHDGFNICSIEEFNQIQRNESKKKWIVWVNDLVQANEEEEKAKNKTKKKSKRKKKKVKYCESSSNSDEEVYQCDDEGAGQTLMQIPEELRRIILKRNMPDQEMIGYDKVETETAEIIASRKNVGCTCLEGKCNESSCECAKNGISCQFDCKVDGRKSYPCLCGPRKCSNPSGKRLYDPKRIKMHCNAVLKSNFIFPKSDAENNESKHILHKQEKNSIVQPTPCTKSASKPFHQNNLRRSLRIQSREDTVKA